MAQRRLEVHPAAAEEIELAYHWYLPRSSGAAERFLEEIGRGLGEIQDSPERWPAYLEDSRRLVLRRYPYSLIYKFDESMLELIAVAHHRRRPGYWRRRR